MNVTKVSSRLTDKDSQPPVYQVGLSQRVYILPGALWATLGHLPPIPQHPRTPGHKAFRSQLTANELGGIRFAGVGPSGPLYNPDQPEPTPSDNLGLWGSGSVSFHKDPTPIGDAGCPWGWPSTDATPRDITLEGLPPPSPQNRKAWSIGCKLRICRNYSFMIRENGIWPVIQSWCQIEMVLNLYVRMLILWKFRLIRPSATLTISGALQPRLWIWSQSWVQMGLIHYY